jgi:hypothetical protein
MQKWRSLEENATDSGYLKRKEEQYERLYYRMSRNPEMSVPQELIEEMQHLVQRTHFINPVHLPALTESFLAKDFDYADYLGRSLSGTLSEHLKTHFVTLLTTIPLLTIFFLFLGKEPQVFYLEYLDMNIHSGVVMNGLLLVVFVATFGVFSFVRWDINAIQKALFPQILLEKDQQD